MTRYQTIKKYSDSLLELAIEKKLMHTTPTGRKHEVLTYGKKDVVAFYNCSYLGLDTDQRLIDGAKKAIDKWGIGFCCARTRMSNSDLVSLEEQLSVLFKARAITFPSVTTTHQVVIPLIAEGFLQTSCGQEAPEKYIFYLDKMAHNSMQILRPFLSTKGLVKTLGHNDISTLLSDLKNADYKNHHFVYFTDGVFSMGGICAIAEMKELFNNPRVSLYIDDAHGTSIYGTHGEGLVVSQLPTEWPTNVVVTFSLAKGFGCNGGGVLFANTQQEWAVRKFGSAYSFSGPLDHAVVGAALESIKIHDSKELQTLQFQLRDRVSYFNSLMGTTNEPFSPIRMVHIGDEEKTIQVGEALLHAGYFVSTVFYPVVPKGQGQLRICLTARHTREQILGITNLIKLLTQDHAPQKAAV